MTDFFNGKFFPELKEVEDKNGLNQEARIFPYEQGREMDATGACTQFLQELGE